MTNVMNIFIIHNMYCIDKHNTVIYKTEVSKEFGSRDTIVWRETSQGLFRGYQTANEHASIYLNPHISVLML